MTRTKALLTAAVAAALMPATAHARIVVGKGTHGLELGDKGKAVKAALGKPNEVSKYAGGESWFYDHYWITLTTRHVARGIEVSDKHQKTDKDIGPGSTVSRLKQAYAVKCHRFSDDIDVCALPTRHAGKKVPTNFVIEHAKVLLIDIGQVGDVG